MPFTVETVELKYPIPLNGVNSARTLLSGIMTLDTEFLKGHSILIPITVNFDPPSKKDAVFSCSCEMITSTGPSPRFLGYFLDIPSGKFYGGATRQRKFVPIFDFYTFIQEKGGTVSPPLMAALLERYKLDSDYTLNRLIAELFPDPSVAKAPVNWGQSLSGMLYSILEEEVSGLSGAKGARKGPDEALVTLLEVLTNLGNFGEKLRAAPLRPFSGTVGKLSEEEEDAVALLSRTFEGSLDSIQTGVLFAPLERMNAGPATRLLRGDFDMNLRMASAGVGLALKNALADPADGTWTPSALGMTSLLNTLDVLSEADKDTEVINEIFTASEGGLLTGVTALADSDVDTFNAVFQEVLSYSGIIGLVSPSVRKNIGASLAKDYLMASLLTPYALGTKAGSPPSPGNVFAEGGQGLLSQTLAPGGLLMAKLVRRYRRF